VFVIGSCGLVPEEWFPAETGSNFTLPYSTAPLQPYQDRMLIYRGLDNVSAINQGGSAHTKAGSHTLTGAAHIEGQFEVAGGGGFSTRISIDQALAQQIGADTPVSSLLTGVDIGLGSVGETPRARFSYLGYNQPVAPSGSASQVFNQLAGFLGGGDPEANAEILRLRAERRSVLDLAMSDIEDLDGSLAAVDRARLDAHLTHLRELEQSIANLPDPNEIDPACVALDQPAELTELTARTQQMLDLIAFALRCDITRVATFQWAGAQSALQYGFVPNVVDYPHHALSHTEDPAQYDEGMRGIARFHSEQVAYLAQRLDQYTEGDGTVLDHSVLVHLNTMSRGDTHDFRDIPVLTIGRGASSAGLDTGRSLALGGRSLNDFHITLAQALGVPMDTFGDPQWVTGPLSTALA
jgi:hypothetical protein